MEEFWKLVASFLGGGIFATLVFVFGQTNKIAKMDGKLDTVCDGFAKHLDQPYHSGSSAKLTVIEAKLDLLERKLDQHMVQPTQSCGFHPQQSEQLAKLVQRMNDFEPNVISRIERLEGKK